MGQDALHLSALKESLLGAEWSADVELAPLPQQGAQNNLKQHIWFIFWPSSHFRKFHIVSPFLFLIRPDSSSNCRSRLSAPLLDNGPGVHESLSVGKAAMGFKDVPGRGVAAHCKICFPLPKILQEGDTKYTIPVPSFASLLFLVRRNGDFFFCSGPEANHFCQLLKELLTRTATTRDSSCNPELELALSLSLSLSVYIYIYLAESCCF